MSLRQSYASVLRLLRTLKGMSQEDLAGSVTQANVSSLELAKSSATVDTTAKLADALGVEPLTLLAFVMANNENISARDALLASLHELDLLGIGDSPLPPVTQPFKPKRVLEAQKKLADVQDFKLRGYSQSETARELGIPESTLRRLWHRASEAKS
ncbi:helix-turn-helix domain-containing protein [Pseudomonas entomophila]|uniref:helix-turn-helix domain-containing protein n=1 Tax=Pseudomonas entomophila TaxID=312306 RepID=UPI0015E3E3FB|nr:helix-turn-helix domain-containing protein [Pseudomonas entomophila]MBA1193065.1 helix-turn-helix domain-containing protein [Pseudomonas entomophila]